MTIIYALMVLLVTMLVITITFLYDLTIYLFTTVLKSVHIVKQADTIKNNYLLILMYNIYIGQYT